MEQLQANYYFNLENYEHSSLFLKEEPVWTALGEIGNYLKMKVLGDVKINVPRGTFLEKPELISIGEGSVVEEGAFIRGPCIIGKNCTIRHGAYIRGNVIAGDRCVIGHATEVKNSILLDGAQASHFAYLGDSILGNDVNLGAGTKCANLKLDGSEVVVVCGGSRFPSGRKKFGAIIGDRVQLGCNSVTNPGTLIGPDSASYPCMSIRGVIPKGQVLRNTSRV